MKYRKIHQMEEEIETDLDNFIIDLPYILSKKDKIIPPLKLLNHIFREGNINSGMSGMYNWAPFSIDEKEYIHIAEILIKKGFLKVKVPEWIITRDDWRIWKSEYLHGIPSEEHKRLVDQEKEIYELYQFTLSRNNKKEMSELKNKHMQAKLELANFLNEWHQKKNKL